MGRRRGRAGARGPPEQPEEGERPAGNGGSNLGTLRYITWVAGFVRGRAAQHADYGCAMLSCFPRRLPLLPQASGGTTTHPRRRKTMALLRHRTSNRQKEEGRGEEEKGSRPRARGAGRHASLKSRAKRCFSRLRAPHLTLIPGTRVTGTPVRVLTRAGAARPLKTGHGEE
jgi:hypothetical protein